MDTLNKSLNAYNISSNAYKLETFNPASLDEMTKLTKTYYLLNSLYIDYPELSNAAKELALFIRELILNKKIEERGLKK